MANRLEGFLSLVLCYAIAHYFFLPIRKDLRLFRYVFYTHSASLLLVIVVWVFSDYLIPKLKGVILAFYLILNCAFLGYIYYLASVAQAVYNCTEEGGSYADPLPDPKPASQRLAT